MAWHYAVNMAQYSSGRNTSISEKPNASTLDVGKNSIHEVHSIVPTVIYQPPESNYMSEKSISGLRKYKHFHRRHLEFLRPVS